MAADVSSGPLFESTTVGNLTLKNRFVMGPMAALATGEDGRPSAQTAAFLAARAKGGVGLIIMGGTSGSERAYAESPFPGLARADRTDFIPDFARVADAVHEYDVPIIAEVQPSFGRMGRRAKNRPVIAASPVNVVIPKGAAMPFERVTPVPVEVAEREIKRLEDEVVRSALNLRSAGFDGIELAGNMSYYLASFLSPRTNHRTDEYGGSIANRARVLVELIRAIRAEVGPDFVVGLRITSDEYLPDGQGASAYAEIARIVADEGLDYVAPAPGCYESVNETGEAGPLLLDHGDIAEFRKALQIPLLLTGVHDPRRAEQAVTHDGADLITLARPLLADPNFVDKLRHGRDADIVRCDLSGYCTRRLMMSMQVRCHVNHAMGREHAITNGAPSQETTLRRRIEDGVLRFSYTRTASIAAGIASSAQKSLRTRGFGG